LLGGSVRFQDGAIVANNPSIIALQEAQCLWPGRSIDVLVSVGTGKNTPPRNERRRLKLLMHACGQFTCFTRTEIQGNTGPKRARRAVLVLAALSC
jgi:hypothetical protein